MSFSFYIDIMNIDRVQSMLPYSAYDQAAIESHGPENVQKMLAVQKVYDPHSVFQRLVPGGQKLPTDMLWLHTWVLKFRISYVGK